MKKVFYIFAIVMCAVSIMTFNAMSATEVDPAVAAANIQGVIDTTKAQNDTSIPETIIIENATVPVAEMPEAEPAPETVPGTVTTPEPTPTPVALATPTPVQVVPTKQDMVQAVERETEEVEEVGAENEEEGETDEPLVLNSIRTLVFMDNGDVALVEEAGEAPELMAICMMTIGKWFPTGDISLYNPTENNLGPAIAVYENEAGNTVTCLNTYCVEESEGASSVLLRLVGQLENEGLANMVFRSDVVYSVVNGSNDTVTVENTGDAIRVSIPNHELSGADFLTLVEGLQAQL